MVRGQSPQAVGTWAPSGTIADGRAGAASTALDDGRTLISGGAIAGTATASVIIYNPADNSSASAGQLTSARVGHTATLLEDGRVLIAGGAVAGGVSADLEVFNPADGTSVPVGTMSSARAGHGAARLADGAVLLVGGSDGTAALASAEVFDPSTSASTAVGSMAAARSGVSATRLIDNRVLVAGGYNGSTDLASAEIFSPFTQTFDSVPTTLAAARSGHSAILLPHNNSVLIAGGTSAGVPVVSSDLFLPAQFPDPYSYGVGQFVATGAMTVARANAASGPAAEGFAFVAGGGSDDAERYRFATIKTDKDDYEPGERAVITGSGWQPNEIVTLLFQEDPAVHEDYVLEVQADINGNIYWNQWAPEEHDLGVRFYLMASDSRSRAQATFTDDRVIAAASLEHNSTTVSCPSGSCTVPTALSVGPGAAITASVTVNTSSTGSGGPNWFSTSWQYATSPPPSNFDTPCADTVDRTTVGTFSDSFATTAPTTPGTYNAYFHAWRTADCKNNASNVFVITNALVVTAPSYSIDDVSANEGNGGPTVFTFTVTKSSSGAASSVQYATANDTAVGGAACGAGIDYISIPATTLNFGASDTTRTIDVTVCGDAVFENDETFFVNLSSPSSGTTTDGDGQGVGTIDNDDAEPTLAIDDVTMLEGTGGTTDFIFTVTKEGTTSLNATVNFATANGTTNPASGGGIGCAAGVDYESDANSLTFAPAEITKTITVNVCGDAVFETNETFFVNLSAAAGATLTDDQGLGTINNDDAPPTLSIDNVTLDEGDAVTTNFIFTVTKSGATEVTATVDFATDAGPTHPATAGAACDPDVDYQSQNDSLSFAPADPTTKTITIKVCGEEVYERNQTFVVNLTNPVAATLTGGGQGLGTITNDDTAPTLSIADVMAAEGNGPAASDFVFTVTASGATEVDATADFATSSGGPNPATAGLTCSAGPDYESQLLGNVTVSAATGTGTITVKVCGDTVYELDQTFLVTLTNPVDATLDDAEAVGTIDNDDAAPTLSINDLALSEGTGVPTDFAFNVTKVGDTEVEATVGFATANGGTNPATGGAACPSSDYLAQTGSLTFAPDETTKPITIQICAETVFELDQDFLVNLSAPTNATLLDGQGVGTILNDDAAPTLNIGDVTMNEGNGPTATNFTFTVSKVGTTEVNATVEFDTADGGSEPATGGSSCGPGVDYVTRTGSLTFDPAETSKPITVYVCGESVFEVNQTFLVSLSDPGNATVSDGEGLGTINNDDTAPSLSINTVTQTEGDSGTTNFTFTVTKTGATELNATVNFATEASGSNPATAGALCGPGVDYEAQSSSLTFAPGDPTLPITIKVCGDITIEPHETFRVVLSAPVNASIGTGTGTGTITNDDLYTFTGFFEPVENLPMLNGVNAGRAIPLKWELRDPAGALVLDLGTVEGITYTQCQCGSEYVDPMELPAADDSGFSELRLTATGYHFNWKTEKTFANKCYEIRVALDDGSVHKAKFKFKK